MYWGWVYSRNAIIRKSQTFLKIEYIFVAAQVWVLKCAFCVILTFLLAKAFIEDIKLTKCGGSYSNLHRNQYISLLENDSACCKINQKL